MSTETPAWGCFGSSSQPSDIRGDKARPLKPPNNLSGVSSRLCHPCQGPQATVLVTLVVSLGRCCGGRSQRAQKAKAEMKGSESARLASICNRAWRGLLGLKRRFHPFPRCCNVSPAGFHLPLIDTQGSNERDGKSGRGRGRGGGTQTPLQRFQNTFRVAANEGIRRGELELCQGEVGGRGSSEALGCGSVPTLGTSSLCGHG